MLDSMKNWDEAGAQIVLVHDEVHVWLAQLDQPLDMVTRSRSILSSDEKSRADRFHFEKDRTAYTVARAALKSLLAKYLVCRLLLEKKKTSRSGPCFCGQGLG